MNPKPQKIRIANTCGLAFALTIASHPLISSLPEHSDLRMHAQHLAQHPCLTEQTALRSKKVLPNVCNEGYGCTGAFPTDFGLVGV